MNYGNSTDRYQLRTPALGNLINPDEELRTKVIIDNQLFGAVRVHSGGHGVIRLGDLALTVPGDGTYTVSATENLANGRPAIEAFINQIYVYQDTTLTWTSLANNTTYYLYIQLVENGTQSSLLNKQVVTSQDTVGTSPTNGLLVAAVVISEPGNSYIVTNPVGKVTIPVLGDHMSNNQNPHTTNLYQDDLSVSGITVLDFMKYRQLQVDQLIISGNQIISGSITCLGNLIISGTIINQGTVNYNQLSVQNLLIPSTLLVGNIQIVSGLDVYPQSLFRQNIVFTSGVTIDGLDPTIAIPLVSQVNVDNLHTHNFGSLGVGTKPIFFSPEYQNTTISGTIPTSGGSFYSLRVNNNNYYQWAAGQVSGQAMYTVSRVILPADFQAIDRLEVTGAASAWSALSGGNIQTFVYDKDFTQCTLNPNQGQNVFSQVSKQTFMVSGGNFLPYYPATIVNRMVAGSGTVTWLGDMAMWYVPINGEKVIFNWSKSGASIENYFDGIRIAPQDLRVEKVIVSQYIGISGASVFDISSGTQNQLPVTLFPTTPKPMIIFNPAAIGYSSYFSGASFTPTENLLIPANTLLTANMYSTASGSVNLNLQLITHRL